MVEHTIDPNLVFGSLADQTRRDILQRLMTGRLSVSEIALDYDMSLAAVSKHLKVLEQANLITKQRQGKQIFVELVRPSLVSAEEYIRDFTSQPASDWQQ